MMGGGRLLEAAQPDEWIDAQEVEATQLGGEYAALFEFGYRSFPLFELQELDSETDACCRSGMQRGGPHELTRPLDGLCGLVVAARLQEGGAQHIVRDVAVQYAGVRPPGGGARRRSRRGLPAGE